jgi:hypothetical protein
LLSAGMGGAYRVCVLLFDARTAAALGGTTTASEQTKRCCWRRAIRTATAGSSAKLVCADGWRRVARRGTASTRRAQNSAARPTVPRDGRIRRAFRSAIVCARKKSAVRVRSSCFPSRPRQRLRYITPAAGLSCIRVLRSRAMLARAIDVLLRGVSPPQGLDRRGSGGGAALSPELAEGVGAVRDRARATLFCSLRMNSAGQHMDKRCEYVPDALKCPALRPMSV